MSNFELYEKVLSTLNDEESSFNAAARNWVEGADEAGFENEEANELFRQAKRHCAVWRSTAINSRISKFRMIDCVRKIAEMNLPNPYTEEPKEEVKEEPKEFGINSPEIKIENEPEAINGWTEKPEKKIFGVVEEEKKIFGRRKKR